jgi:hypothetical protein
MAYLLSGRRVVFVAAGIGMLFGGCAACYIVRRKLTDQILSLNQQMTLLRQEVDRLRNLVEEMLPPRQTKMPMEDHCLGSRVSGQQHLSVKEIHVQ